METRIISLLFFLVCGLTVHINAACGKCSDGKDSLCFTTQTERNRVCPSRRLADKNYCGRLRGEDECSDRCHCCGNAVNEGCNRTDTSKNISTDFAGPEYGGYKCFGKSEDRNKKCQGYTKWCQSWGVPLTPGKPSSRKNQNNEMMTYCCAKSAYPAWC